MQTTGRQCTDSFIKRLDDTANGIQREYISGPLGILGLICIIIIVSIFLKNLFLYLSYYVLNPLKNKVVNSLRPELYNKILHLPIGYFTEKRKGDLISRITNDVNEVEGSVVSTLEGWVRDPLTILLILQSFFISARSLLFLSYLYSCYWLCIGPYYPFIEKTIQ